MFFLASSICCWMSAVMLKCSFVGGGSGAVEDRVVSAFRLFAVEREREENRVRRKKTCNRNFPFDLENCRKMECSFCTSVQLKCATVCVCVCQAASVQRTDLELPTYVYSTTWSIRATMGGPSAGACS